MFRPTTGELIAGISDSLRQSVLPELASGNAQRQLKAALHALERVSRSWDLLPDILHEDNRDIAATIAMVLAGIAGDLGGLPAALADLKAAAEHPTAAGTHPIPGVHAASLAAAGTLNMHLQVHLGRLDSWLQGAHGLSGPAAAVADLQLENLYSRMIEREIHALGIEGDSD